jgi:O-antigen/teichoic acid export membrane protein
MLVYSKSNNVCLYYSYQKLVSLQGSKMLSTILKNFKSLLFAQIISQIFGFFTVVYLARTMGASGFGIIVFAQTLLSYFGIISDLGITRLGTREVARNYDVVKDYVENVISIRIILTLIAFILVVIGTYLSDRVYISKLVIILFSLSLFANTIFVDWIFKGLEQMQYVAIANIIERVSYFVLVMTIVDKNTNIIAVPLIYFVGNLLASAYLIYILSVKIGVHLRLNYNYGIWKKFLYMSLPLALSNVMVRINNNIDTLFLGILKNDEIVGYYNAAYKIILVVFLVGGFYVTAIFPSASRLFHNSIKELEKLLNISVRLLMLIGIPIAFGGVLLAKQIITSIYGQRFVASVDAFQVLCIYIPLSFVTMVYADTLIACDMQKDYAVGMAISATMNIAFNLLLIPSYGMVGAATATIISEAVLFTYSYFRLKRLLQVGFIKQFRIPIVSSVVMCSLLIYVHYSIVVMISLGAITYLIALVLLKGITLSEMSILKNMISNKN